MIAQPKALGRTKSTKLNTESGKTHDRVKPQPSRRVTDSRRTPTTPRLGRGQTERHGPTSVPGAPRLVLHSFSEGGSLRRRVRALMRVP